MDQSEEAMGAPAGTMVPQELLEEMIWFFRVEDATPWNYSMLALAAVVLVISMTLLGRNILANRKRKRQPQEKETPGVPLDDTRTNENSSLNNVRETLISEMPNLAQEETELKEKDVPLVPSDSADSES